MLLKYSSIAVTAATLSLSAYGQGASALTTVEASPAQTEAAAPATADPAELDALREQVATLQTDFGTLNAMLTEGDDAYEQVTARLATATTDLATANGTIDKHTETLAALTAGAGERLDAYKKYSNAELSKVMLAYNGFDRLVRDVTASKIRNDISEKLNPSSGIVGFKDAVTSAAEQHILQSLTDHDKNRFQGFLSTLFKSPLADATLSAVPFGSLLSSITSFAATLFSVNAIDNGNKLIAGDYKQTTTDAALNNFNAQLSPFFSFYEKTAEVDRKFSDEFEVIEVEARELSAQLNHQLDDLSKFLGLPSKASPDFEAIRAALDSNLAMTGGTDDIRTALSAKTENLLAKLRALDLLVNEHNELDKLYHSLQTGYLSAIIEVAKNEEIDLPTAPSIVSELEKMLETMTER